MDEKPQEFLAASLKSNYLHRRFLGSSGKSQRAAGSSKRFCLATRCGSQNRGPWQDTPSNHAHCSQAGRSSAMLSK